MKKIYSLAGGLLACLCIAIPWRSYAFPVRAPEVQIIDLGTREVEDHFFAFENSYRGGVSVAVGDVAGDGKQEIIVAQSGGHDAHGLVRIFNEEHELLAEWFAFPEAVMYQEMEVTTGDIDADGKDEIFVTRPRTANSTIAIFNGEGKLDTRTPQVFEAFPGEFGGVSVAVGDVTGDARREILAATGRHLAPRVRIMNISGENIMPDLHPFAENLREGMDVAVLDTDADGHDEIVVGLLGHMQNVVKTYKADSAQTVLGEFHAWSREWPSGVRLAAWDRDENGTEELVLVPHEDQRGVMRVVRSDGSPDAFEPLQLFEEDFLGGVDIAIANMDDDAGQEAVVAPTNQRQRGDLNRGDKYIELDLSDQTAILWEGGYLRHAALVSSGLPGTPTPVGDFSILKKIERHIYRGPNYYFPNTLWNLRFKEGGPERNYYFHTAYWHNNFGRPMSHGCVNMREADAKFLYHWADLGTPAWIHD